MWPPGRVHFVAGRDDEFSSEQYGLRSLRHIQVETQAST